MQYIYIYIYIYKITLQLLTYVQNALLARRFSRAFHKLTADAMLCNTDRADQANDE